MPLDSWPIWVRSVMLAGVSATSAVKASACCHLWSFSRAEMSGRDGLGARTGWAVGRYQASVRLSRTSQWRPAARISSSVMAWAQSAWAKGRRQAPWATASVSSMARASGSSARRCMPFFTSCLVRSRASCDSGSSPSTTLRRVSQTICRLSSEASVALNSSMPGSYRSDEEAPTFTA